MSITMPATRTVRPARTAPKLPRRARSALLTVHVIMSVGWIGLNASLVVLGIAALRTGDPAAAAALGLLGGRLLPPFAFAALVTGLVLSLTTPWGLLRYWWVLAKFVITVALVAGGLLVLLPRLDQIADGATGPVRVQVLVATSVALVLLMAATVLSVVKPWGKTARGRVAAATAPRRSTARSPG